MRPFLAEEFPALLFVFAFVFFLLFLPDSVRGSLLFLPALFAHLAAGGPFLGRDGVAAWTEDVGLAVRNDRGGVAVDVGVDVGFYVIPIS